MIDRTAEIIDVIRKAKTLIPDESKLSRKSFFVFQANGAKRLSPYGAIVYAIGGPHLNISTDGSNFRYVVWNTICDNNHPGTIMDPWLFYSHVCDNYSIEQIHELFDKTIDALQQKVTESNV